MVGHGHAAQMEGMSQCRGALDKKALACSWSWKAEAEGKGEGLAVESY